MKLKEAIEILQYLVDNNEIKNKNIVSKIKYMLNAYELDKKVKKQALEWVIFIMLFISTLYLVKINLCN